MKSVRETMMASKFPQNFLEQQQRRTHLSINTHTHTFSIHSFTAKHFTVISLTLDDIPDDLIREASTIDDDDNVENENA